jgi:hypothetical protein
MFELIKELENNKNDTIRIDYIIKKLKNIYVYEEFIKNEIDWIIEEMYNDDLYDEETKEKIGNLSAKDIQDIVDVIVEDDYVNEILNDTIKDVIRNKIGFEWE